MFVLAEAIPAAVPVIVQQSHDLGTTPDQWPLKPLSHGLINNLAWIWIRPGYEANGRGANPVCFYMDTLQRWLVFYIMTFTSDKNTASLLLVWSWGVLVQQRSARRCRVARVADWTRSYTQMNRERLLATAAHYVSAKLSMQLKSKNSCPRTRYACRISNRGYASSSCRITPLSAIFNLDSTLGR